jgi:hypothetical protein
MLVPFCLVAAAPAPAQPSSAGSLQGMQAPPLRGQMSIMEGILEKAVIQGIRGAQAEMPELLSGPWLFAASPRARGFKIDGYGVFFDVEVPGLPASITWSFQVVNRSNDAAIARELDRMRGLIASVSDQKMKADLVRALDNLQQHVPGAAALSDSPMRLVNGQMVSAAPAKTEPPPSPNEVYTRQVRNALVTVMLEQGIMLQIAADDWFTVAACDSQGAGEPDLMTLYLSIKGRDLAALRARQITPEEAAKRIVTRNY